MPNVVGVSFKKNGKVYYFSSDGIKNICLNSEVIVKTERGDQFGIVTVAPKHMDEINLGLPLKSIVRVANNDDKKINQKNLKDSKNALLEARKLATKLNLPMRIIDASFTFDRNQLLFQFLADDRVDFRELAKKLAQIYKTRIELRQIGVRDKAKEVGGIGPCGRFLCCSTFLTDFNSVSINMAKNQMLALNPTKINGVCGRLLCCLNYEDDIYTEMKKGMPSIGQLYKKDEVEGKVVSLNIIKRTAVIETKNKTLVEVEL